MQFVSIGAYPLWSFALLGMDLLILYGFTVHPGAYADGERIVGTPPPEARMDAPPPLF